MHLFIEHSNTIIKTIELNENSIFKFTKNTYIFNENYDPIKIVVTHNRENLDNNENMQIREYDYIYDQNRKLDKENYND